VRERQEGNAGERQPIDRHENGVRFCVERIPMDDDLVEETADEQECDEREKTARESEKRIERGEPGRAFPNERNRLTNLTKASDFFGNDAEIEPDRGEKENVGIGGLEESFLNGSERIEGRFEGLIRGLLRRAV
jgi:hypothetical protein